MMNVMQGVYDATGKYVDMLYIMWIGIIIINDDATSTHKQNWGSPCQ